MTKNENKDSKEEAHLGSKIEAVWTNDWSIMPSPSPDIVAGSLVFKSLVRSFAKPIGKFKCLDCGEEYAMHFKEDHLHSCYSCGSENIETTLFKEVDTKNVL